MIANRIINRGMYLHTLYYNSTNKLTRGIIWKLVQDFF